MPCYHPLTGYIGRESNPSGKKSIVFKLSDAWCGPKGHTITVQLPCGQCIGCRLERARQWAMRCVHEASLYDDNCFITLTFSDDTINKDGSLVKADFQKFMKRLRKKFKDVKIRYFHCGEYGSKLQRPHHHACLFNFDFKDKELWSVREGVPLYRSKTLERIWSDPKNGQVYGFATVGDVNFDSACYVARYCVKKLNGQPAETHYKGREPEYVTMSRRPGIGRDWFEKFKSDVYPHDYVVIRDGVKCKPPKYYDSIYDLQNPEEYDILKNRREVNARENPDNSMKRLEDREKVCNSNLKRLERSYETEGI